MLWGCGCKSQRLQLEPVLPVKAGAAGPPWAELEELPFFGASDPVWVVFPAEISGVPKTGDDWLSES